MISLKVPSASPYATPYTLLRTREALQDVVGEPKVQGLGFRGLRGLGLRRRASTSKASSASPLQDPKDPQCCMVLGIEAWLTCARSRMTSVQRPSM